MTSISKAGRLRKLTTGRGVIAALAIDQRSSLRQMLAGAFGVQPDSIADAQLAEFKCSIAQALTAHASAVLLDNEYGLDAAKLRAPGCGLLLAYEMDGFENPRPHRMLALRPELSVQRLRNLGADGVKILVSYTPFDDPQANDAKKAMIERIGCECEAAGLPFFLEPVGYDPGGLDVKSEQYARIKPEVVVRSMEEFSRDIYHVDVLKVEFPVNGAFVKGSPACAGSAVYTREEAIGHFRAADAVTHLPYIYLSAGVGINLFAECLGMAAEAGGKFAGVLCGRATWQGGAKEYAGGGVAGLDRWLADEGTRNIQAVNDCLQAATPLQF